MDKQAGPNTFTIDNQTFRDLNVFSSQNGAISLYDLFKGTRTIAARERLRTIMQNPSSDLREITLRRDAIRYFHEKRIVLEIRNEEIDLIDFYLKSTFRKFRDNPIDSFSDYLRRNTSNDYYVIKTGIRYLLRLSKYIQGLSTEIEAGQPPQYILQIFRQINTIVSEGVLLKALLLNEDKLSFTDVCKLDRALRGKEAEQVRTFLELIYELDVLENIAAVAARKGFSYPVYSSASNLQLTLKGMFHPAINNPVRNDLYIDATRNIVFLSGSNMAGKSSLLKTVGLAVYLSHLGFPVSAEAMETTIFNGLITTINLSDDISSGLSHYYSEVMRVKDVSRLLLENNKLFVIFDELFRGTNVKDAFDASSLIISELSAIRNSAFFISTHIVELAEALKAYDNISFCFLDTYFENSKPVFTYSLREGVSKERLGMYIVENEGIVEILRKAAARPA